MVPLDIDETLDQDTLTAYIAIWTESRTSKGFNSPSWAGSYGVLLVGGGERRELWGGGYGTQDDSLRAFAVLRVLQLARPRHVIIHTKGLVDQVRTPDGHVRKALARKEHTNTTKEPYDNYEAFAEIARAIDRGDCEIRTVRSRQEPDQYRLAERIAKTIGRETALRLKPLHWHTAEVDPRNLILATDEDPDPYGLGSMGEAAE